MDKTIALISTLDCMPCMMRSVRSGGIGSPVIGGSSFSDVVARLDHPLAIFCDASFLDDVLSRWGNTPTRVIALCSTIDIRLLTTCVRYPQIGGVIAADDLLVRPWELTYYTRRLVAPTEPPPSMGALLAWGASSLSWTPRTTKDLNTIVKQIEQICLRMSVSRWQATRASNAAHELLMNAMYDAPVNADGTPRYAANRAQQIELEDAETPTFVFTITGEYIAIEAIDPNGGLARNRFFEGILRGQRNLQSETTELDTSHGGAGLGLYTLFHSSSILRAEVIPGQATHVSWVLDRNVTRRSQRENTRSLYFLPTIPEDVIEFTSSELSPL